MCGVNGIFIKGKAGLYRNQVEKMNHILRHRGPNDEGIFSDNDVVLGHRRLSIIDLSSRGKQPMSDSNGQIWVTFNGEIYNYHDLKRTLESKGHRFRSDSDTEVIVYGYKEWGTDVFKRLEGMFAIALWDKNTKDLFLGRDACGIKPLFYSITQKGFVFSSEIKGILVSGLVEADLQPQSLSNFLSSFYIPSPETIIKNIKQIPPGYFIRLRDHNRLEFVQFWKLENKMQLISHESVSSRLKEEASKTVASSLVSDVPISLLLSSGLDSSIILSVLKDLGKNEIKTVTIGFENSSFDESKIAKRYALDMGFENETLILPKSKIPDYFYHMIYHLDCLIANPSILAEYIYFKEVAKSSRVVLMGSGMDELLAGYPTYLADGFRKYYGKAPNFLKKMANSLSKLIPYSESQYPLDYVVQKFTEGAFFPKEKSHYWWRSIFSDEEKLKVLKKDFVGDNNIKIDSFYLFEKYFNEVKDDMTFEDQALYVDFYTFLIDNANIKNDQLSMAFSLETRPPFLSKCFAQFAFNIPYELKHKRMQGKHCLRKAYDGIIPKYITNRKKQGLVSPLHFLFADEMNTFVSDHLFSKEMSDYFNLDYIQKLLSDQKAKRKNNMYKLFSLLCFSVWQRQFLTNGSTLEVIGG